MNQQSRNEPWFQTSLFINDGFFWFASNLQKRKKKIWPVQVSPPIWISIVKITRFWEPTSKLQRAQFYLTWVCKSYLFLNFFFPLYWWWYEITGNNAPFETHANYRYEKHLSWPFHKRCQARDCLQRHSQQWRGQRPSPWLAIKWGHWQEEHALSIPTSWFRSTIGI